MQIPSKNSHLASQILTEKKCKKLNTVFDLTASLKHETNTLSFDLACTRTENNQLLIQKFGGMLQK